MRNLILNLSTLLMLFTFAPETSEKLVAAFASAMQPLMEEIDQFLAEDWTAFRQELKEADFDLFSSFGDQ